MRKPFFVRFKAVVEKPTERTRCRAQKQFRFWNHIKAVLRMILVMILYQGKLKASKTHIAHGLRGLVGVRHRQLGLLAHVFRASKGVPVQRIHKEMRHLLDSRQGTFRFEFLALVQSLVLSRYDCMEIMVSAKKIV